MSDETDECNNPRHRFLARDLQRVTQDNKFWRHQVEEQGVKLHRLKMEVKWRDYRDADDVAWLQRKVLAQRQRLAALEQRNQIRAIRMGLTEETPEP